MNNSPLFVIGCPRSGKTLLGAILNKHPDALIFFETNIFSVIFRLWNKRCREKDGELLTKCLQEILFTTFGHYHAKLGLSAEYIWNCLPDPEEEHWGKLFDQYIRILMSEAKPTARIWGDKTPHHVGYIEQILQVYPEARFIYSYRDPRDVVNSMSEPSYTPATPNKLQNASIVRRYLYTYETNRKIIPPKQLLEIRYEHLVANPEDIVKSMCSFLQIDYSPILLEPANQDIRDFVGWPNSQAWNIVAPQTRRGVSSAVESYLADWTIKQGYELDLLSNQFYWLVQTKAKLLPFHVLFAIYNCYWKRKYPDSPLLLLRLPYLQ